MNQLDEENHSKGASTSKLRQFSLYKKLKELNTEVATTPSRSSSLTRGLSKRPRIQMASPLYRDKDSVRKYMVPKVYSFGPIHHGKPDLRMGEGIKLELAKIYVKLFGLNADVLLPMIRDEVGKFKTLWYDADLVNNYDEDELSWILFVDGCALLYYTIDAVDYRILGRKRPVNFWPKVMHADAFRLENQLPYELLRMLIPDYVHDTHPADQHKLIDMSVAFYSIFAGVPTIKTEVPPVESVSEIKDRIHMLDVVWKHTKKANGVPPQSQGPHVKYYHVSYTIQELKRVGIRSAA